MSSCHERILVVDDEPTLRMLIAKVLGGKGYTVNTAEDGIDALRMLENGHFDLVITDMVMPAMGGKELVGELQQKYPRIPILVITGFPQLDDAVDLIRKGVKDYVSKPLKLDNLITIVRKTLDERESVDLEQTETMTISGLDCATGQDIGGYRILKVIGRGSMGIVYLVSGTSEKTVGRYALKVLDPGIQTAANTIMRERFLREAEIAKSVEHPNIVRLYDFGIATEAQVPFMVLQYVEGEALSNIIERKRYYDYHDKARIILQIAEVLTVLHERGLVHRDIKPSNILVQEDGHVMITDFGLVKLPDSDLTDSLSVIGTPAYLAPEAFSHAISNERVDLFALGVVAYEFFTGHRPFDSLIFATLVHQIEKQLPIEPRRYDPGFPLSIQAILARLLKKDPAQRYGTAREVCEDLRAFVDDTEGPVRKLRSRLTKIASKDWR